LEQLSDCSAVLNGWDLLLLVAWILLTPELVAKALKSTFRVH